MGAAWRCWVRMAHSWGTHYTNRVTLGGIASQRLLLKGEANKQCDLSSSSSKWAFDGSLSAKFPFLDDEGGDGPSGKISGGVSGGSSSSSSKCQYVNRCASGPLPVFTTAPARGRVPAKRE